MAYQIHDVANGDVIQAQTTIEQDTQIAANESAIGQLQTKVNQIETNMPDTTQIENDVSALQASVGGLTTTVNEMNTTLGTKMNEPTNEGTNGQVLTTDGNGNRTWTTVQGGGGSSVEIDDTLTQQGEAADAKAAGDALATKLTKPATDGTNGQVLMTDGQGGASWADALDDTTVGNAVGDYIDEHPEVVAVADGSITKAKLATDVSEAVDAVPELQDAYEVRAVGDNKYSTIHRNTVFTVADEYGNEIVNVFKDGMTIPGFTTKALARLIDVEKDHQVDYIDGYRNGNGTLTTNAGSAAKEVHLQMGKTYIACTESNPDEGNPMIRIFRVSGSTWTEIYEEQITATNFRVIYTPEEDGLIMQLMQYHNAINSSIYREYYTKCYYVADPIPDALIGGKRPYQRVTYFQTQCAVNNPVTTDFDAVSIDTVYTPSTIYTDNCVLYLPTSYTPTGTPTKLVIWAKQGGSFIGSDTDEVFKNGINRYLLANGYAILAADGVPDGWSTALDFNDKGICGNYVVQQSTRRAYDYVIQNYNIDQNGVFLHGYSQGGQGVINIAELSGIPVLAVMMMAPALSMKYHIWTIRTTETHGNITTPFGRRWNLCKMFNIPIPATSEEFNAMVYDPQYTQGYDAWVRNASNVYDGFVMNDTTHLYEFPTGTTVDDITMVRQFPCPVKVWFAEDDETLGADVMKAWVKAVQNSGQVAAVRIYSTGGHHPQNAQTAIGTFTENGTTYNIIPLYKEVAQWFEMFGGYHVEV